MSLAPARARVALVREVYDDEGLARARYVPADAQAALAVERNAVQLGWRPGRPASETKLARVEAGAPGDVT